MFVESQNPALTVVWAGTCERPPWQNGGFAAESEEGWAKNRVAGEQKRKRIQCFEHTHESVTLGETSSKMNS